MKVYLTPKPLNTLPMVFAEDIRKVILKIADERGTEIGFAPSDVAQQVDLENWQSMLDQVRFVASILEKEGKIKTRISGGQLDFRKREPEPDTP